MPLATPPPNDTPSPGPAWAHRLAVVCGLGSALIGAIALAGWITHTHALIYGAWGISVKTNAAIGLILAGSSLVLLDHPAPPWRARLGRVLAGCVIAIGLATLVEHVTGWNLRIDQLLFRETSLGPVTLSPNRMGVPASLCLSLIGCALLCLDRPPRKGLPRSQALAIMTIAIALVPLTGYIFQLRELFGIARYTAIALHTAIGLLVLACGILLARPEVGVMRRILARDAGGLLLRRMLPAALLLPIVLGWLRIVGEDEGLYNRDFGRTLLLLGFMFLFAGLTWWTATVVAQHALALAESRNAVERALATLRQSEQRFAAVFHHAPVAIALARMDSGALVDVNPAWERLSGYGRADAIGRTTIELGLIVDPPRRAGAIERARRTRRPVEFEMDVRTRSGPVRTVLTMMSVVMLGDDAYLLTSTEDVTERKQAMQVLRDADRQKDEFLAVLAHELRNPLAPIRNAAAILHARGGDDPDVRWSRDVIDRQAEQMGRLLDDLLDVSRITQRRLELRKEKVTLRRIVDQAVETSRPLIDAAGHRLSVSVPATDVWLEGDPLRLAQVLANLLNNAAKYTERGGQISVNACRDGAGVTLSVRDTGIGIERDQLAHVFDLFAQAAPALERSQGGLGIGLSLVRGIVEAHGGSVEARSAGRGRGSEFIVRLPASLIAEPPPVVRSSTDGAVSPALRVLVADDNPDGRESLAIALRLGGHEVHAAADGLEAVQMAERFHPDVALLDIGMPGLNGYEAARRIRSYDWGRLMVLVALTGWGQQDDRQRAADAGFDHHLVKPASVPRIEALLGQIGARSPA
jgi:PAS domain S-box-containing protein